MPNIRRPTVRSVMEFLFALLILAFLAVSTYSTWQVNEDLRAPVSENTRRMTQLEDRVTAHETAESTRVATLESRMSGFEARASNKPIVLTLPKPEPKQPDPPPKKKHWWEKN